MVMGVRDLRDVFKEAYYHIYTNDAISRAERLMSEFMKVLHCLLVDSSNGGMIQSIQLDRLSDSQIADQVRTIFDQEKSKELPLFRKDEKILLSDTSINHLVRMIAPYNFNSLSIDVLAGAFETLIHPSVRGDKGQFFTPRALTNTIIELLNPKPSESIIDPACGTGGFLVAYALHLNRGNIGKLTGIDKDSDMFRLTTTYLETLGIDSFNVFNCDSLDVKSQCIKDSVINESYDLVITNPPFGTRIQVTNKEVLNQYELGYKWRRNKIGEWNKSRQVLSKQHPQILFIERCLQLLKPEGRMAIILPEGVFTSTTNGYIWSFINSVAKIDLILDCPRVTFQPSTDTKTNVLFLTKRKKPLFGVDSHYPIMAIAEYCGHDRRGRTLVKNDFPIIIKQIKSLRSGGSSNRFGFHVEISLVDNPILVPRYHDPEILHELEAYRANGHTNLISINHLMKQKILQIRKGHEVGSEAYGTGDVPFIRTSDLNNWEITQNPTNSVADEYYEEYKLKQKLHPFDILFVNDGRYRIGKVCILGENDTRIIVQSHIKIITIRTPNEYNLDSFLFLYLLSHPIVKKQIKAKTFIHSTIASLGSRLNEVLLPLPTDQNKTRSISEQIRKAIMSRHGSLSELKQMMGLDYVDF